MKEYSNSPWPRQGLSGAQSSLPTKAQKANANDNFREALREHFSEFQRKNSSYSLRAFAKKLDVDQSYLTKFMKGERNFSIRSLIRLGGEMGMTPLTINKFLGVQQQSEANSEERAKARLQDDQFKMISEWPHLAILEAFKLKDFEITVDSLAKLLNLHSTRIRTCLERLKRIGFIELSGEKLVLKVEQGNWFDLEVTNSVKIQLQKELAQLNVKAVEDVTFVQRFHGSLTVAIDSQRIPEFQARFATLLEEFARKLQDPGHLDAVYQLTIGFFPLSKNIKKSTRNSSQSPVQQHLITGEQGGLSGLDIK